MWFFDNKDDAAPSATGSGQAESGGLRPFDRVLSVDGMTLTKTMPLDAYTFALLARNSGDAREIGIERPPAWMRLSIAERDNREEARVVQVGGVGSVGARL